MLKMGGAIRKEGGEVDFELAIQPPKQIVRNMLQQTGPPPMNSTVAPLVDQLSSRIPGSR
jgi:hypothetical protein